MYIYDLESLAWRLQCYSQTVGSMMLAICHPANQPNPFSIVSIDHPKSCYPSVAVCLATLYIPTLWVRMYKANSKAAILIVCNVMLSSFIRALQFCYIEDFFKYFLPVLLSLYLLACLSCQICRIIQLFFCLFLCLSASLFVNHFASVDSCFQLQNAAI